YLSQPIERPSAERAAGAVTPRLPATCSSKQPAMNEAQHSKRDARHRRQGSAATRPEEELQRIVSATAPQSWVFASFRNPDREIAYSSARRPTRQGLLAFSFRGSR